MDISYLGAGCVRLSGKQVEILIDPYGDESGLGKIKVQPDAVLYTDPESPRPVKEPIVIDGPGEYEIKNTMIAGVAVRRHVDAEGERGTFYVIEIEEVTVAYLGNIIGPLSQSQQEAIGQPGVLILPVGGHGLTLDAQGAAELVSQVEPGYVVPVHYDDGKTKYAMPQDGVDKFLKETGATPEKTAKLRVTGKEMPTETTVVILEK